MKTFVLMISKTFPCGTPTGFRKKLEQKQKIHTIRENYPFWEKRILQVELGIAQLSIREWSGKPYRSKQVEIMVIGKDKILSQIGYQRIHITKDPDIHIANYKFPVSILSRIAKNDGLSLSDFIDWFVVGEKEFSGIIIHFSNLRY